MFSLVHRRKVFHLFPEMQVTELEDTVRGVIQLPFNQMSPKLRYQALRIICSRLKYKNQYDSPN